ncbi:LOW QUALITY PROTEIN: hypothetical protein MSG28_000609 [Choristoneura fumiferana]|uniref:Uncharacterized protein n=1 Tax=Choristoneura fumiferana TaxID=7141 RepID=A0ACC0K1R7_CHOFU|nr:LOW QUALITY PROTEIN: hypothetical protein MSG28_000609 [Choristoneura fumiferana]
MTGAATRRPAHKTPPHTPGGDTVARTREQRESAKVQSARGKEKESDAARKRQGNTEGIVTDAREGLGHFPGGEDNVRLAATRRRAGSSRGVRTGARAARRAAPPRPGQPGGEKPDPNSPASQGLLVNLAASVSLGTQRTTPSEIQVGRSRYPYTSYTDHSGSPVKLSATRGNKDGYMNIYSIKAKYPTQAKVRNVPRAEWYEELSLPVKDFASDESCDETTPYTTLHYIHPTVNWPPLKIRELGLVVPLRGPSAEFQKLHTELFSRLIIVDIQDYPSGESSECALIRFAKCLPHLLLSHSLTNLFPQRYLLLLSYSNILFLPLLLLPYVLLLPALRGWKTQTCPRQPYSWNVAPLVWLAVHKAHRQPMPRRPLNDDDIVAALNMGSESDSDDSDEEGSSQPFIPRILGAILETPEDDDESTDDSPSLSPPLRSILLASASSSMESIPEFPTPSIPSALRRELFSDINVGPTVPNAAPFVHICDRQFLEHIVSETNKYAQQLAAQLMLSNNLHRQSRICDWQDTSSDELYVYMAINVAMGVVTKGRVSDYRNADETIFLTPRFRVYMSLRSFSLHFRDNRDMYTLNLSHSEAKLYKIQPVVDHLNNAFQSLYNLQQNIALDESLLQWKVFKIEPFLFSFILFMFFIVYELIRNLNY